MPLDVNDILRDACLTPVFTLAVIVCPGGQRTQERIKAMMVLSNLLWQRGGQEFPRMGGHPPRDIPDEFVEFLSLVGVIPVSSGDEEKAEIEVILVGPKEPFHEGIEEHPRVGLDPAGFRSAGFCQDVPPVVSRFDLA
jgi:hypothetical protein